MALVKMNYSEYQKAIFSEIKNGKGNIAVNAVAGSGKTTTIVSACKQLHLSPKEVKFLAFNKLIAEELKTKLNGYADVSTLHAFGYSILKNIFNNPSKRQYVKVDSYKWGKYLRENLYSLSSLVTIDTPQNKQFAFRMNVQKLFDLARINLIPSGHKDLLERLCDKHNIITLFDETSVCDIMLEDAYVMQRNPTIDYTDMIVLPLSYRKFIPTYKFVFIDECQDLNMAQRELMLCAAKNGRFIAVGDRNQAINGFCGADCKSFDNIANLPNTKELPLSVNYRCGSNMIKLAKELVPNIIAHDGAIKGNIVNTSILEKNMFYPNDMVLCRKAAPLVGLCMKLIESGVTAVVKGKDIAQELKTIIDGANARSIDDVLDYLKNTKEKTISCIMADRKCKRNEAISSTRYHKLEDNCKCIENICNDAVSDVRGLKTYIDRLFTDDKVKDAVMLSTVHKSKGLEADRVIIIAPHLLSMRSEKQKEWEWQQELNLKYVAVTRAKKELVFVNMLEDELLKVKL